MMQGRYMPLGVVWHLGVLWLELITRIPLAPCHLNFCRPVVLAVLYQPEGPILFG